MNIASPAALIALKNGPMTGASILAQQVGLTQPEQDPRRRQHRDRQHEALAQPLQLRKAGNAQTRLLLDFFGFRRFAHVRLASFAGSLDENPRS